MYLLEHGLPPVLKWFSRASAPILRADSSLPLPWGQVGCREQTWNWQFVWWKRGSCETNNTSDDNGVRATLWFMMREENGQRKPSQVADSASVQFANECSNGHNVLVTPSGNMDRQYGKNLNISTGIFFALEKIASQEIKKTKWETHMGPSFE